MDTWYDFAKYGDDIAKEKAAVSSSVAKDSKSSKSSKKDDENPLAGIMAGAQMIASQTAPTKSAPASGGTGGTGANGQFKHTPLKGERNAKRGSLHAYIYGGGNG